MNNRRERRLGWISLGLWAALGTPLARSHLEASLLGHLLIQMPLLVMVGLGLSGSLPGNVARYLDEVNEAGITGLLTAAFTVAFWMLPRSLDAALATVGIEVAKFVTLPLLVGVPLGLSWSRLNTVARGFVLGNLLSMLGFLGWLYVNAPVRFCNYYLINEQMWVGSALLGLAAVVAVPLAYGVFAGPPRARYAVAGSEQPLTRSG